MMNVFVDTNILLDVLADRKPFVATSRQIWELSETNQIKAMVSAISFNNIYYILRKAGGHTTAKKALKNLRAIFTPVAVDEKILHQAIDADHEDFEDAIQYYSALRASAESLITRNANDFPNEKTLPILTPETFLAIHKF